MKKLLFILSFVSMTITANAQWKPTNGPYGGGVNVWSIASIGNNIFAGTEAGGVFLSSNNGSNWAAVNTGLTNFGIYALAIIDTNIFAGTDNGGVFISSNNGASWTTIDNGLPNNAWVMAFGISGANIFAGTNYSHGVFLSTNNGTNWTAFNNPAILATDVRALVIKDTNIFAGTLSNGVFRTTVNDTNWTTANNGLTNKEISCFAIKDTSIFAGTAGGIFLSTDNGNHWISKGLSSVEVLNICINDTNILVGTDLDGIYLSTNNGTTWNNFCDGLTYSTVTSFVIIGDTIFAGIDGGGVWKRALSELSSIEKINNNLDNIAVYPNPATDNITVETYQKVTIEILNMQGQPIQQQKIQQGKTDIDISGLAKGVYILRLCRNDRAEVTRIVKE